MVRRNPYKMKLKKKRREEKKRKEATLKGKKEEQKKRETYADSIPGVVFFFCSK